MDTSSLEFVSVIYLIKDRMGYTDEDHNQRKYPGRTSDSAER